MDAIEDQTEEIRKVINNSLGRNRLDGFGLDDPLLQSGLISSLEIVVVTLALENYFKVTIPDSAITVQSFFSLRSLSSLISEYRGTKDQTRTGLYLPIKTYGRLFNSLMRCFQNSPYIMILLVLSFFIGLDLLLPYVVGGPLKQEYADFHDYGRRLYKSSGGWGQDDFAFTVSQYEVITDNKEYWPRVAVFGDSGTIGSWVPFYQTAPFVAEEDIKVIHPNARVSNLGYFQTSYVKDVMFLEEIIQQSSGKIPFNVVVFSTSTNYFNVKHQSTIMKVVPYFSFNRLVFEDYSARVSRPNHLEAYLSISSELQRNMLDNFYKPSFLLGHTSLSHYNKFYYLLENNAKRKWLGIDSYNFDKEFEVGKKEMFSIVPIVPPSDFVIHDYPLTEDDIDQRMINLMDDTIRMLTEQNIKVVFYIKPMVPKEWQTYYPDIGGATALQIISDLCQNSRCEVVDLRYSLNGSQFTDSLAHYTAFGNKIIGDEIAKAIMKVIQ